MNPSQARADSSSEGTEEEEEEAGAFITTSGSSPCRSWWLLTWTPCRSGCRSSAPPAGWASALPLPPPYSHSPGCPGPHLCPGWRPGSRGNGWAVLPQRLVKGRLMKKKINRFKTQALKKLENSWFHLFVSKPAGLTCVHLIHTVQEVIWSARNTVAAHTQAAVCALISGVVSPANYKSRKSSELENTQFTQSTQEKCTASCCSLAIPHSDVSKRKQSRWMGHHRGTERTLDEPILISRGKICRQSMAEAAWMKPLWKKGEGVEIRSPVYWSSCSHRLPAILPSSHTTTRAGSAQNCFIWLRSWIFFTYLNWWRHYLEHQRASLCSSGWHRPADPNESRACEEG